MNGSQPILEKLFILVSSEKSNWKSNLTEDDLMNGTVEVGKPQDCFSWESDWDKERFYLNFIFGICIAVMGFVENFIVMVVILSNKGYFLLRIF